MDALKNVYSEKFFENLSKVLIDTIPGFNKKKFLKGIHDEGFDGMELKQRMSHVAKVLYRFMPEDYKSSSAMLLKLTDNFKSANIPTQHIEFMFLPEYISMYGQDHFDLSVKAMEKVTQFISCEFAVRPFIIRYKNKMMSQMLKWSKHPNRHVRRLSSEGSRPRLPWAMGVPELKKDPSSILPILENLKEDDCEIVRRSVANNLNDISKDHPEILIKIAKKWKGKTKETDAIIKHASRSLLKAGNSSILDFYNLNGKGMKVQKFSLGSTSVGIGDRIEFNFTVKNTFSETLAARLEYGIHFRLSNGTLSRKVFKISERNLKPGEEVSIKKSHSFRIITTRKFYPGLHMLSVIVNGKEHAPHEFNLH
ncbi:MAG: DNA alkylation repair protein [Flavitalea sp.]